MKLIKPSFNIIEQPAGLEGIYKQIERAGRVSHKSEDKITDTSAKDFVGRMLNMKHLATCEFGTIYLKIPSSHDICLILELNPYTKCVNEDGISYVTTNYRTLVEYNALWLIDKYLCEPAEYHHKRYTVKFICDRAIANEIVRHRKFSFLQESTRYCRYSTDKFNNELTFIKPCWCDAKEERYWLSEDNAICSTSYPNMIFNDIPNTPFSFLYSLLTSEQAYFNLLKEGWKAEQARAVLPLALKTELYMCGYAEDWKNFFELRTASNAHPQVIELAFPLHQEFLNRGYL